MKIAIINIGMHGHMNPTLGFTEELAKRGHDIAYFTTAEWESAVVRAGARFCGYGSKLGSLATLHAKDRDKTSFPMLLLEECRDTIETLVAFVRRETPDLIVYDFLSVAGRLVAGHFGVPAVKLFSSYALNEKFNLLAYAFAQRLRPNPADLELFETEIAALCARFHVPPFGFDSLFTHPEATNVAFLPKAFQPHAEAFDERYTFVGPGLRAYDRASVDDLLPTDGSPLLLISLGTIFNAAPDFYRECLRAFGGTPWHVVMSVGTQVDIASLGPIPANMILRPHVPQLALLEHASLFVSHGGMNSTQEALYFGVPLVVIPQMEEQEMTARRIDDLRLGKFLPPAQANATTLLAAIETLTSDPGLRERVAAMQAHSRAAGGGQRAADVLEYAGRAGTSPQATAYPAEDLPRSGN